MEKASRPLSNREPGTVKKKSKKKKSTLTASQSVPTTASVGENQESSTKVTPQDDNDKDKPLENLINPPQPVDDNEEVAKSKSQSQPKSESVKQLQIHTQIQHREPTQHDITNALCKNFAYDLLDFALDLCSTRFVYERAPEIIAWELRDSWLSIVSMNWMDNILSPAIDSTSIFKGQDEPAVLPPKFDFWSHGALEQLPKMCRESIMDPFLRDPLPWYLGTAKGKQNLPVYDSTRLLPRPTSPVPTDEDTWSTTTSADSVKNRKGDRDIAVQHDGAASPRSAASMTRFSAGLQTASIELLYPTRFPKCDVTASSEMAYNMAGKDNCSEASEKGGELIAFKLPHQTSSESMRSHVERKNRKKERKSGE